MNPPGNNLAEDAFGVGFHLWHPIKVIIVITAPQI
jgi:hypothetical protein